MNSIIHTTDAILAVNASFYSAFRTNNFAEMDKLWAHQAEVFCMHPGARLMVGRDEVLNSWKNILDADTNLDIRFLYPHVCIQGKTAWVTGYEFFFKTTLTATNIFVNEKESWRLALHQAAKCEETREEIEKLFQNKKITALN